MKQPLSVFSNLLYLAPAYTAVRTGYWPLYIFAAACVVLTVGSGLYHYYHQLNSEKPERTLYLAIREAYWRLWDHRGMYLVLTTSIGCLLTIPVLSIPCLAAGIYLSIAAKRGNLFLYTGILVGLNILTLLLLHSWELAAMATLAFLAAFGARQLTDRAHEVASGNEDVGHAAWHFLTALGLLVAPYAFM